MVERRAEVLFTENETNFERLFPDEQNAVREGCFSSLRGDGERGAVNPADDRNEIGGAFIVRDRAGAETGYSAAR